jgi:hypothetical protein
MTSSAPLFSDGIQSSAVARRHNTRRSTPKKWILSQLLAGSYREQRRALNLLKGLTNELMIPVVAVGTEDALHAIQTDAQVASRFDPLHLPRWSESDVFRNFIVTFGKQLPLRRPSPFGDRDMIRLLLACSHGITGSPWR